MFKFTDSRWTRHFVYRRERTRTTWKLRFAVLTLLLLVGWLTHGWFSEVIGESLICESSVQPSDAILVENFDPGYLTFETAAHLRRSGVATRVLVPVSRTNADSPANPVALGIAELMASLSRLGAIETIPIREIEPISLNAARDILRFFQQERIRSVVVVSPLFRSRRSQLVYEATLGAAGIQVRCEPVRGERDAKTWTRSWHGIQNVAEQWLKLQYYKLYVLPFRLHTR